MLLGEILRNEGFCTEKDILAALDTQVKGDSRRIGEILLEKGAISVGQLEKALKIQRR